MFSFARARTRVLIASTVLALGATIPGGALLAGADANPPGTGLVINEVYGAGATPARCSTHDYVELYNHQRRRQRRRRLHPLPLGLGQQRRYARSPSPAVVPAHGHYLIQMGSAGANGAALPTPDAGPAGFSHGGGWRSGVPAQPEQRDHHERRHEGVAGVVDLVGQAAATTFETMAAGAAASTTNSLNRSATGGDSNNNSVDFSLAAPSPENSNPVTRRRRPSTRSRRSRAPEPRPHWSATR